MKVVPSRVRVSGPLAGYAEGFVADLGRLGYTSSSATAQLYLMAHVSRWLSGRGLDGSAMTVTVLDEFVVERRALGYVDHVSVRALAALMAYLRCLGAAPAAVRPAASAVEELLARYRAYLGTERGLRPATADRYVHLVRPFLVGRVDEGGVGLAGLTAADVSAFVVAQCRARPNQRGSVKSMVTALRSVLRFLHVDGAIAQPLFTVVPSVAAWKLAGLPRGLDSDQVRALLAAAGPDTAVWARDRAILVLLVRLGLRVGEVAALRLDDIDWHHGEVVVRGKGDRHERLPLPADVGQAMVCYLREARPRDGGVRAVFVAAKAPWRALTPGAVTQVVARAAQRAGLGWVSGHRLRHTAASAMLRGGASLSEIGDVLRHRDLLTTTLYAKVDTDALRTVARPWPGDGA